MASLGGRMRVFRKRVREMGWRRLGRVPGASRQSLDLDLESGFVTCMMTPRQVRTAACVQPSVPPDNVAGLWRVPTRTPGDNGQTPAFPRRVASGTPVSL